MSTERVPPLLVRMGLACHRCFQQEDLSRCSGCRRVSYCSTECQKMDWKLHKAMCKALCALEKDPATVATLVSSIPVGPSTDLDALRAVTEEHRSIIGDYCQLRLNRQATVPERNLAGFEPRCIVCPRTDQLIRMEASRAETTSEPLPYLSACPRCDLSFCCSAEHWAIARPLHEGFCEDGHDGLSHCDLNCEVREDITIAEAIIRARDPSVFRELVWAPERILPTWMSLNGTSWETQFGGEMRQSAGFPETVAVGKLIRIASDNLSMPMTILYALEQLNVDDAWTRKQTLTIHIIGAEMYEFQGSVVLEEIMHRLPEVKTLKLVLCGPGSPANVPQAISMETCPECTRRERKRLHVMVADSYHVFARGSSYESPDLCVAFNSVIGEPSAHTQWPATVKLLVDRKLPSVFTSYNRQEAEEDAAMLRVAGATLLPNLGPHKNPWGSMKLMPEPNHVFGFYAVNAWIAGGFR
ncbi:hypothetical protein C8R47DRAFT_1158414 [Mycena vitilis]|nr:hypothetical protein C8R47DRAFT_1158414 [Mycena vitilis]